MEKKVDESSKLISDRVSPVCIAVPLSQDIIRPIPKRATTIADNSTTKKAVSAERLEKVNSGVHCKSDDTRSFTDPRQGTKSSHSSHPTKLMRSLSPRTKPVRKEHPLPKGSGATVVNIGAQENDGEDYGYKILSSRDEEAERDLSEGCHEHKPQVKPRRKSLTTSVSAKVNKPRQHKHPPKHEIPLENVTHLLDVKAAIERLQLHSPVDELNSNSLSDSSASSTEAVLSSSTKTAPKSTSQYQQARKKKHLSQETLNNSSNSVTSTADEFVWIDSHNRLVELQQLPWSNSDIAKVIETTATFQHYHDFGDKAFNEVLPRISYYMQRVLVRITREAQRLSKAIGMCSQNEIKTSLKLVLPPDLSMSAIRACIRASAMYAMSGDAVSSKQSKSERAGLSIKVGKMHQWMCLVKVGKFVHSNAAIYLTASIENIIESLVTKCLQFSEQRNSHLSSITSNLLEQIVTTRGEFWGIFQPYAHLNSSRIGSGTLVLSPSLEPLINIDGKSHHTNTSDSRNQSSNKSSAEQNVRQILLTTCVGSMDELEEMVLIAGSILRRFWHQLGSTTQSQSSLMKGHSYRISASSSALNLVGKGDAFRWCPEAVQSLYHFMRCSQLEYVGQEGRTPIQELVYERPYMVLPPVIEWVRIASALSEHRNSMLIDNDDILQAARILLPGMDCPPRALTIDFSLDNSLMRGDELQSINEVKSNMAFKLLMAGRRDLIPHAIQIHPEGCQGLNHPHNGCELTPLQLAAITGDINIVKILIDTGADQDAKGKQSWTPLCYACLGGHTKIAKILLERGAKFDDSDLSETPLQLAAGAGHIRIVELLIQYGANPFASILRDSRDTLSLLPSSFKCSCPSPISIAAIHGHRRLLHHMITHCLTKNIKEQSQEENDVLSLEEILAEGISETASGSQNVHSKLSSTGGIVTNSSRQLSKLQIKKLQEAMYHASESGNIELTLDLRNLGVHWTPFTWTTTLRVAYENHMLAIMNELLQDFSADWLDDAASKFIADTALPLLFSIFKACKSESTIMILADIFSLSYKHSTGGKVKFVAASEEDISKDHPNPRIDSKFINSPELSDVQFRVEGRIFYAHKLALITASPRFQSMLSSRFCEGNPPVLQINDIRYEIFHLVMTYLYNGGLGQIHVDGGDVLELMAAANFFQLPGLLRHCEVLCSKLIDLDNIVSYYIHAKVYVALELLDFCEGFLLKNLVSLLTYDDSVKRLIFGKKLQNHDVLEGLLKHLKQRITEKSK